MEIVKIITSLIMPIGLIMLILIGILIFKWKDIAKGYKTLLIVFLILTYIFSTVIGVNIVASSLEEYALDNEYTNCDVVIVLSGGINLRANDKIELSPITLDRLYHGFLIAKKYDTPIIITGADFSNMETNKAGIMKQTLLDWGIDESKIIVEPLARNTYEHAVYCKDILEELSGINNVVLATSASHMKRSIKTFEKYMDDYDFSGAAAVYNDSENTIMSYLPSTYYLNLVESALHEHIGTIWYKIRYWR